MHHDTPDPQVRVHLEWGPVGASLVRNGTVAVVVDVLSFTTTVSVATDPGVEVLPHPLDADATGLADRAGSGVALTVSATGVAMTAVLLSRTGFRTAHLDDAPPTETAPR